MTLVEILTFLIIGLPDERPGGITLSIILTLISGGISLVLGYFYAIVCNQNSALSLALRFFSSTCRGIPPLLLFFLIVNLRFQIYTSPLVLAIVGLSLYSFSHVSEILRIYHLQYPSLYSEQAKLLGLTFIQNEQHIKIYWVIRNSWKALSTHWISLIKDTGGLVIVGIAELTTIAKLISEVTTDTLSWVLIFLLAGLLYFLVSVFMVFVLEYLGRLI